MAENSEIEGKNFTKDYLVGWGTAKWLDFLRFTEFHASIDSDSYDVTVEKIHEIFAMSQEANHPWGEFILRTGYRGEDVKAYKIAVRKLVNVALPFLKERPSLITDDMKAIMMGRPMLVKYLKLYFLKADGKEVAEPAQVDVVPVTPATKNMDTVVKMIDLHGKLVDSISDQDIKRMAPKDKFNALPKIVDAIVKMSGKGKVMGNFTQVNINGSVREIEEGMLAFIKDKERGE